MIYLPGPVCKAQDHIMILAAVQAGAEQFCILLQQMSGENAEMTDVIVSVQGIRRIIRLKMHVYQIVQIAVPESGLIAIKKIRPGLIDGLRIFI